MSTLKSQLESLGYKDSKAETRGSSNFDDAIKDGPKLENGKIAIWYKWLIRRRLPKNMSDRCCMCGKYMSDGLERTDNSRHVEFELKAKKLKPAVLYECNKCQGK